MASEPRQYDFAARLESEQIRIARAGWMYVAAYLVATTAPFIYLDLYASDKDRLYILSAFISWAAGYLLFLALMQEGGYLADGKRTGFGTYFAISIAIGIPVALGSVVLVLPGLYLLMRWLPAYSRALLTMDGVGNSMRWSWTETEPLQRQLSLAMVGPLLCYAAPIGMQVAYDYLYELFDWTGYTVASFFWNSFMSVGMAWLTILGIAAFGLIDARNADPQIFS